MPRLTTLILFGATNQKFGADTHTTLDLLSKKLDSSCVVIQIRGVGVSPVEDDRQRYRYLPSIFSFLLRRYVNFYDSIVGTSVAERIALAWSRTSAKTEMKIVAGSSRGGFSAQLFSQVVNDWGFAHDYPLDLAEAKSMIEAGKRPPAGTTIGQRNIERLYALDPVGSMGLQRLFSRSSTPLSFLGYRVTDLPPNINFTWVILMASESAKHFTPNLFATLPQGNNGLRQVWFEGVHGDAWEPSFLSKHVLALVLGDLHQAGLDIPDLVDVWADAPPSAETTWTMWLMRAFKKPRAVLQGTNQFRHQTLTERDFLVHPLLPVSLEENAARVQLGLPALEVH